MWLTLRFQDALEAEHGILFVNIPYEVQVSLTADEPIQDPFKASLQADSIGQPPLPILIRMCTSLGLTVWECPVTVSLPKSGRAKVVFPYLAGQSERIGCRFEIDLVRVAETVTRLANWDVLLANIDPGGARTSTRKVEQLDPSELPMVEIDLYAGSNIIAKVSLPARSRKNPFVAKCNSLGIPSQRLSGLSQLLRNAYRKQLEKCDSKLELSQAERNEILQALASVGWDVYHKLWVNAHELIQEFFRRFKDEWSGKLAASIVTSCDTGLWFPWGLLYSGPKPGAEPLNWDDEWKHFWGFFHQVTQIPLGGERDPEDGITLPVVTLAAIAKGAPGAKEQEELFGNLDSQKVDLRPRPPASKREQVLSMLLQHQEDLRLAYFYAHGEMGSSWREAELEGETFLVPTDPERSVTLCGFDDGQLTVGDFQTSPFCFVRDRRRPVFFFNACHSVALDPNLPNLIAQLVGNKHALGIIGTESTVPSALASEFARRFFGKFFNGQPLAQALRETRIDLFREFNNPFGLLYSAYVLPYVRLKPRIASS